MARQPTCPQCNTDVRPSWDWCHTCGYDPAGLKPANWAPEGADVPRRDAANPTTWVAPAPPGAPRAGSAGVTTLVDPEEARPQRMRDPDWVRHPSRRGISIPALVGLVAVAAAAVVCLVVVTIIVLNRPIGTSGDGAQAHHGVPVISRSDPV